MAAGDDQGDTSEEEPRPTTGRYWTPRHIIASCEWCGKWLRGPFKGRYDVPREEMSTYFEPLTGHPAAGEFKPAPYRPGGMVYMHTASDEPYSGSMCMECSLRKNAEQGGRLDRLAAAMGKPRTPQPPAASAPEESETQQEPTEEEARRFLMGLDDDDDNGEGEGEEGA